MNRKEFTKEDLELLNIGCIFTFPVWDNEENHEWIFTYQKLHTGYLYLGGGIDFGHGIGKIESIDKVIDYINRSDFPGIEIVKEKL